MESWLGALLRAKPVKDSPVAVLPADLANQAGSDRRVLLQGRVGPVVVRVVRADAEAGVAVAAATEALLMRVP